MKFHLLDVLSNFLLEYSEIKQTKALSYTRCSIAPLSVRRMNPASRLSVAAGANFTQPIFTYKSIKLLIFWLFHRAAQPLHISVFCAPLLRFHVIPERKKLLLFFRPHNLIFSFILQVLLGRWEIYHTLTYAIHPSVSVF